MTDTTTLTPVMVWADGLVSTGTDRMRDFLRHAAHGMDDEQPTEVYVNQDGHLVQVDIRQSQGAFDNDDYATVTVRLFPKGSQGHGQALLTFTYSVDGRA